MISIANASALHKGNQCIDKLFMHSFFACVYNCSCSGQPQTDL